MGWLARWARRSPITTGVFSLASLYEMVTGKRRSAAAAIEVLKRDRETPRLDQPGQSALRVLQPLLDRAMADRDRADDGKHLRDDPGADAPDRQRTGVVPTEATATLIAPQRARSWSLTGSLGRVLGRLRPMLPGREPRSGPEAGAPAAPHPWQRESRPTLVVLPFRNLAMNPDAAFYEFALADGVITELAQVKSIVVRPSACIAPYVGQSVDPRQVADEMAATLVLACGFIRTQERMRVTAQLLDAASGDILWSDKVDLLSRDLLDVQDEIARRLLASLRLRLSAAEQQRLEVPLTASPEAYEFYLRARDALFAYLLRSHEEGDLDRAVKMLHEAIGLDPDFARAHATLGRCYVLYAQGWGGTENFVLAERSLTHALAIEHDIVNARLQMVYVDLHQGDKEKARARVAELVAERPDDTPVLFVAGMLQRLDGLYEKALATYDRLLEVNPKDVDAATRRGSTPPGAAEEAVAETTGRAAEPAPAAQDVLAVARSTRA